MERNHQHLAALAGFSILLLEPNQGGRNEVVPNLNDWTFITTPISATTAKTDVGATSLPNGTLSLLSYGLNRIAVRINTTGSTTGTHYVSWLSFCI